MHLAIVLRRDTRQPPKDAGEVALCFEALPSLRCRPGSLGFAQIFLRAFHSLTHYVLMRSGTGTHLEELGEVVLAHSGNVRQFDYAEFRPMFSLCEKTSVAIGGAAVRPPPRWPLGWRPGRPLTISFICSSCNKGRGRTMTFIPSSLLRRARSARRTECSADSGHAVGGDRGPYRSIGDDDSPLGIVPQYRQGNLFRIVGRAAVCRSWCDVCQLVPCRHQSMASRSLLHFLAHQKRLRFALLFLLVASAEITVTEPIAASFRPENRAVRCQVVLISVPNALCESSND